MNIAKRSVDSAAWNTIANFITLPIGFIQSIILARYLPVEYFGVFGGVVAMVTLINPFFDLGLLSSYLHRSKETEDEIQAINALFTLRFLLSSIQFIFLILIATILFSGLRQTVLIVLTTTGFFSSILSIPIILLTRQINFKPLAIFNITSSFFTALISSVVAILTSSIWALLTSSIISLIWVVIFFYTINPVWLPRFSKDMNIIKYYLRFGTRVQFSDLLSVALDNIDDIWTNLFLGDILLGFYSRAYKFATYPRTIIVMPVQTVANSTYAELKNDRKRLSRTFFRVNAFLIRVGFLIAGWLFIIAPQFISIFLGNDWLPMLSTFRLLLIFAMLDPIKGSVANILIVSGVPQKLIKVRAIQLIILFVGLFSLGTLYGINGVAISMDLMLLIGLFLLYQSIKPYVDYSLFRLFTAPFASISISFIGTWLLLTKFLKINSDWVTFSLGSVIFISLYSLILVIIEGRDLYQTILEIVKYSPFKDRIESILNLHN